MPRKCNGLGCTRSQLDVCHGTHPPDTDKMSVALFMTVRTAMLSISVLSLMPSRLIALAPLLL